MGQLTFSSDSFKFFDGLGTKQVVIQTMPQTVAKGTLETAFARRGKSGYQEG
jgi:hypothetical protein